MCVVDCDPHGIDILRTYKYGSRSLGHEENATVPGLQWLGVKMEDILRNSSRPRQEDWSQSYDYQTSQSSAENLGRQSSGSGSFTLLSNSLAPRLVYYL